MEGIIIMHMNFLLISSHVVNNKEHEDFFEREYYRQGFVYKDEEAFLHSLKRVCYVPELTDAKYTQEDFMEMCNGQEDFARECFYAIDWQHPETWIEEQYLNNEWGWCNRCEMIYEMFGDSCACPKCGMFYTN